jgi:hypothetical protein
LINQRERDTGEVGGSEPEYRLPPAILGAVLVPVGLFWFAWYAPAMIILLANPADCSVGQSMLRYTGSFQLLDQQFSVWGE